MGWGPAGHARRDVLTRTPGVGGPGGLAPSAVVCVRVRTLGRGNWVVVGEGGCVLGGISNLSLARLSLTAGGLASTDGLFSQKQNPLVGTAVVGSSDGVLFLLREMSSSFFVFCEHAPQRCVLSPQHTALRDRS